jgi:hypothetical protein
MMGTASNKLGLNKVRSRRRASAIGIVVAVAAAVVFVGSFSFKGNDNGVERSRKSDDDGNRIDSVEIENESFSDGREEEKMIEASNDNDGDDEKEKEERKGMGTKRNKRFVGDIKMHREIVEMVEKRATGKNKRIVLTTFDKGSYVFALHHALNVERVLRESEEERYSSSSGGSSDGDDDDIGGWVALTYKEETCVEFERLWKLAHEHNYHDEDVDLLKQKKPFVSEIGCVWDSRFRQDGLIGKALNAVHKGLFRAVTQHGHLLWMARWDLMARIALRGVQIIGSDADVVYTTNPFPFLTTGALGKYSVMIAEESHESGHAQCGLSFLNGKKIRADGPSVKLIADVPLILRRVIDAARDFPDFRKNYLYRKITREEDIGHGVTIFFDQHLFKDSIITHARGHRSFTFFFGDGINNWGNTKDFIDMGLGRDHKYRHGTGGYDWNREVMSVENGYDKDLLERFGIRPKEGNFHILWTPLKNKLAKESEEEIPLNGCCDGSTADDFRKMITYLKSWKEKKQNGTLFEDGKERQKMEDAVASLDRLTCGATDEEIENGPFFGTHGYDPLPSMENIYTPNVHILSRSYKLELEREIRDSSLPKGDNADQKEELFAFLPQWLVQTWRVGMQGTFIDPSRLQDARNDARAIAFHATNAWDKVGTLKTIGLWDERVDVALEESSARHKLAHRMRVKTVAYLPQDEDNNNENSDGSMTKQRHFLEFESKEDFVLAGFYGLAMVAKKSKREMATPRPPCGSKWIRYFTDSNRWQENPFKFRRCAHPFCDEWKIVPVLRKNNNNNGRKSRNDDLSAKYSCEIQGEAVIDEDPNRSKNKRLMWGGSCKHTRDKPKGLAPSDLDFYMKIFPDVKPRGSKSFFLEVPRTARKNETTGIYHLSANELSEMITNADNSADVWYLSKPIAPDFSNEDNEGDKQMHFDTMHYCQH